MILKRDNRLYNFEGFEDNGLEFTLRLEYWYKLKDKNAYRKAKRAYTVHSWEQMIELMEKFEEVGVGKITATELRKYLD